MPSFSLQFLEKYPWHSSSIYAYLWLQGNGINFNQNTRGKCFHSTDGSNNWFNWKKFLKYFIHSFKILNLVKERYISGLIKFCLLSNFLAIYLRCGKIIVRVGQPVIWLPPHRSQRSELPHWALQKYSLL